MNYGIYKGIRSASWHCLIDCGANALPIDIGNIVNYYGGRIIPDSKAKKLASGESGKVMLVKGALIIIVNDNEPRERQRFTAMHELGHYLLGHLITSPDGLLRTPAEYKPAEEREADMFAARVLAPACVLWGLGFHTADEIAEVCRISHAAAKIRAERMALLYKRNKFLADPLEKEVFGQFEEFIIKNLNINRRM